MTAFGGKTRSADPVFYDLKGEGAGVFHVDEFQRGNRKMKNFPKFPFEIVCFLPY